MTLSKQEQDMFFQNYFALLYYASVYEGILPEGSSLEDFYHSSFAEKAASRDALFNDKSLIKNFKQDNKHFFGNILSLDFVNNIQKGFLGSFAFIKEIKWAPYFIIWTAKKFMRLLLLLNL